MLMTFFKTRCNRCAQNTNINNRCHGARYPGNVACFDTVQNSAINRFRFSSGPQLAANERYCSPKFAEFAERNEHLHENRSDREPSEAHRPAAEGVRPGRPGAMCDHPPGPLSAAAIRGPLQPVLQGMFRSVQPSGRPGVEKRRPVS
uniref:(northern house mosquito) hypothetical protein n=1 Tax=Culex pipiens TaxID=7175 RepID=A0A8D8CRR6_CULPI